MLQDIQKIIASLEQGGLAVASTAVLVSIASKLFKMKDAAASLFCQRHLPIAVRLRSRRWPVEIPIPKRTTADRADMVMICAAVLWRLPEMAESTGHFAFDQGKLAAQPYRL
ncbi:hypothetical protein GFM44_23240 [Rhizobium leguminosarum bv. viciae]|nr:hypothetical protein [Rhizobium leguminosarum bv. viciae]